MTSKKQKLELTWIGKDEELKLEPRIFHDFLGSRQIAQQYTVHDLAYYALDVAKAIHVFYRHVPVLASPDDRLIHSRLQLVLASRAVLGKTLDLLGVSKPDVM